MQILFKVMLTAVCAALYWVEYLTKSFFCIFVRSMQHYFLSRNFFFYFLVNKYRNTFIPSSGTVCLSGLLIYVGVVRAVADSARQDDASGQPYT